MIFDDQIIQPLLARSRASTFGLVMVSISGMVGLRYVASRSPRLAGVVGFAPSFAPITLDFLLAAAEPFPPTLLVWGAADRTVPLAQARRLESTLGADCTLKVLERVDHSSYVEDFDTTHALMVDFFRSLEWK